MITVDQFIESAEVLVVQHFDPDHNLPVVSCDWADLDPGFSKAAGDPALYLCRVPIECIDAAGDNGPWRLFEKMPFHGGESSPMPGVVDLHRDIYLVDGSVAYLYHGASEKTGVVYYHAAL